MLRSRLLPLSRRCLTAALLLSAGATLTATGTAKAQRVSAVHVVRVTSSRFTPDTVRIALGDTVRWEFADSGHSATAVDWADDYWDSEFRAEGATFEYTFEVPGDFRYYCRRHGGDDGEGGATGVTGRIIVDEGDPRLQRFEGETKNANGRTLGEMNLQFDAIDGNRFVWSASPEKGVVGSGSGTFGQNRSFTFKQKTTHRRPTVYTWTGKFSEDQFEISGKIKKKLGKKVKTWKFTAEAVEPEDEADDE